VAARGLMWWWYTKLLVWTGGFWPKGIPTIFYNEWSGFLSCLGLVAASLALVFHAVVSYRHKNCEVHRCPRIVRHTTAAGHRVCRRHMPGGAPTHQDVIDAHNAAMESGDSHD
jgi:hypothetical protein